MSDTRADNRSQTPFPGLRAALDLMLAYMPEAGLCTLDLGGRIDLWHASAERILGHHADQVDGRSLAAFMPEERRFEALLPRALFTASRDGSARLDTSLQTRMGSRLVCRIDIRAEIDADGVVAGFVALMHASQALQRDGVDADQTMLAADHRRNLAAIDLEPAWLGLDLNARVTCLSERAARDLGRPIDDFVGRPIEECLARVEDAPAPEWMAALHRAVRSDTPLTLGARAIDTPHRLNVRILPLDDAERRLQGFTLALEVQPVIQPAPTPTVDQQQRNWLLAAAHDLREPLRKMHHYAEHLQTAEAPRLSEDGRRQLASLHAAAGRMQGMVNGVLRLARVDSSHDPRTTIDLSQLVEDVRADLNVLIEERGARLSVGSLGTLIGDAGQLRALFQNLIDNSIRYHRDGVAPEIDIQPVVGDDPKMLVIDYRDNARGFDPDVDVFSPERVRSAHGTGIGLPLCARICERHAGSIHIQETGDTGTCFRITLAKSQRASDNP